MTLQQISEQLVRFSRDAMAKGVLDEIGEQIFTTGTVRKALDKLFMDPPTTLIRTIRSAIEDDSIKSVQVKAVLKRLWTQTSEVEVHQISAGETASTRPKIVDAKLRRGKEYSEEYHTKGKPQEVTELFRTLDKFCRELDPTNVQKRYHAKYVAYAYQKSTFCSVHIQKSGLRVWLKLDYARLENPSDYVRNVSTVGHWGLGNVELAINSFERLQETKTLIRQSFEENR